MGEVGMRDGGWDGQDDGETGIFIANRLESLKF